MHCDFLCDGMIYYMLCINSQPSCHVINFYINAQMIIIMINAIYLGLLSIMLIVITSLHRKFGVEGKWVCYHVICDAM